MPMNLRSSPKLQITNVHQRNKTAVPYQLQSATVETDQSHI